MLDFVKEAEKSRQTINSFIEGQTKDKIKDLIPTGYLDETTRLVLTNAIYFKGIWEWEFDKTDTREQDFKTTSTNIIKTPIMSMNPEDAKFNYAQTEDLQILELPYKGNKISMLILLPTENLDLIESSLTVEKLNGYKSQMEETKLDSISLPKFEFDSKYFMKNTLVSLGMPKAFSNDADFSGMTGKKDLYISNVIHQAYVGVDEEGTEAAAATAVVMELTAMLPMNVFRADHPFIFIIQEKDTGNILFLGRVVDPTK
jgi:serpin B